MEKEIKIYETESRETIINIKGYSALEVLGVLRYYEKVIWLNCVEQNKKLEKKRKENAD